MRTGRKHPGQECDYQQPHPDYPPSCRRCGHLVPRMPKETTNTRYQFDNFINTTRSQYLINFRFPADAYTYTIEENPMTDQEKIAAAMPGDWIKAKYDGHPFEGESWALNGALRVGDTCVRYGSGEVEYEITDVTVTPAPWPTGTVLVWKCSAASTERTGIVRANGRVDDGHVNESASFIRTLNPTVLRLGGAT